MADALGLSICRHCGAEYRLFTISNKDMQALCRGWKRRHEWTCSQRTAEQRRKWAKPYIGKDQLDSSIVVDMSHPGFGSYKSEAKDEFERWFETVASMVFEKTGITFLDKDSVREDFEAGKESVEVGENIVNEYSQA